MLKSLSNNIVTDYEVPLAHRKFRVACVFKLIKKKKNDNRDFPSLDWREVFALVFRYGVPQEEDLTKGFQILEGLLKYSNCDERFLTV